MDAENELDKLDDLLRQLRALIKGYDPVEPSRAEVLAMFDRRIMQALTHGQAADVAMLTAARRDYLKEL
jgi:hypothetical protein